MKIGSTEQTREPLDPSKTMEVELLLYEDCLRAWLNRQFRLRHNLDDVVQESFLRVIKAADQRTIENPKAYLFSVARNVAYAALKKEAQQTTESFEEGSNVIPFDGTMNSVDRISMEDDLELLRRAIQKLPKRCRRIFIMRRIKGLPSAQIAKELGLSTNTISHQLTIGLHKCASYIEKHQKEPMFSMERTDRT